MSPKGKPHKPMLLLPFGTHGILDCAERKAAVPQLGIESRWLNVLQESDRDSSQIDVYVAIGQHIATKA
jgi:hypothetical protein